LWIFTWLGTGVDQPTMAFSTPITVTMRFFLKQQLLRSSIVLPCLFLVMAYIPAKGGTFGTYTFTTFAGNAGYGSTDGAGNTARFNQPRSIAADAAGNVYVADTANHTIRKISALGVVTTFAGSAGIPGSADGVGTAARFNAPEGVALDASGDHIYIADTANDTIRVITRDGAVVTTIAGLAGNSGSADGNGTAARFAGPMRLAVDGLGNVYIADYNNSTVRKMTSAGVVTTLAGAPGIVGSNDGTGPAAQFFFPSSVAVDAAGNVYVADTYNYEIRKITSGGVVTTLAGNSFFPGSADGIGTAAQFYYPVGIAVDESGNVYVAENLNSTIRKITPAGVVTTLAGRAGYLGAVDGTGSAAVFNNPSGVVVDAGGNLYVADRDNDSIRKVTSGGIVTTLAGQAPGRGSSDGIGTAAQFWGVAGIAIDGNGNVYVADSNNCTVRKITAAGVVTTFAGKAGASNSADGTGSAARFTVPAGAAVDVSGNVYIADSWDNVIRKITPDGVVTTLAGSAGSSNFMDGIGSNARFHSPEGLAVDPAGNVYVADASNHAIRKITSGGVVTTLAGLGGVSGHSDGTGINARFNTPFDVVVDNAGNVYVADSGNDLIRKITSDGVVTTLAGAPLLAGSDDGPASSARFDFPTGLTMDKSGNLFVADENNQTIREITVAGVVRTIAGVPGLTGATDGTGSGALFSHPYKLALDGAGNLYVADSYNNTIRKGVPDAPHYADFNDDGQSDIVWENTVTGERGIWLMNGSSVANWAGLPTIPTDWHIVGTGDFNGDGQTDVVWENSVTGERGIWLMNGSAVVNWAGLPTIPTDWHIVGTGDFNGDGQTDIVWENTTTGERGIWLMNGSMVINWAGLPTEPTTWRIAGTGDFNGDGQTDIVWENATTDESGIWLMNGSSVVNWAGLPTVPTDWHIVSTGDFNSDGQIDIVWENSVTGERGIWLMNGVSVVNWTGLPTEPTNWHIVR
jgi:NHL repeat